MKKILITGMNKNQCTKDFYLNQQLQVVPSHYSLIRCLEDMGYEVEQKHVEIGESLDKYYKVIVFIHNPSGFAGYVYNALYAIQSRPDCILAFDDWQTESIFNGILSLTDTDTLFRKFVKDSHKFIPNNIESYENMLLKGIEIISNKKNKMLISAFAGGDLGLLIDYPIDLMYSYNPNPYHLNRRPNLLLQEKKTNTFNFAGLIQNQTKKWLEKQNIEETGWELKKYGSRKDGQDRVTEDEMVNIFGNNWCTLMAGYHHSGSGWWRARPLQVADAGGILIGDSKELNLYYKDEKLSNLTPKYVSEISDYERVVLAEEQMNAIYKNHPLDKSVQQKELGNIL